MTKSQKARINRRRIKQERLQRVLVTIMQELDAENNTDLETARSEKKILAYHLRHIANIIISDVVNNVNSLVS